MSRTHATVLAVLLALNAVVGTVALARTLHLGQASHTASNVLVAKRAAQLDRFEASLKAQLAKKPPALPKVPPASTVSAAPATSAAPAAAAPQVVRYVRPAPIIIHKHRAGGEYEVGDAAGAVQGDGGGD